MPRSATAAMLLAFDVVREAIAEHDDWHTREHLPERLAIPGFLRGSRWVAVQGAPRYCVLYEVEHLATLGSDAYLARLDHPTPWTARMMQHYRGMTRGLCSIVGSAGAGVGQCALLARFGAQPSREAELEAWLCGGMLDSMARRRGVGSARLLRRGLQAAMTREQRIRGADAGVDWALFATGYDAAAIAGLRESHVSDGALLAHGACDVVAAPYRLDYSVSADDVA